MGGGVKENLMKNIGEKYETPNKKKKKKKKNMYGHLWIWEQNKGKTKHNEAKIWNSKKHWVNDTNWDSKVQFFQPNTFHQSCTSLVGLQKADGRKRLQTLQPYDAGTLLFLDKLDLTDPLIG